MKKLLTLLNIKPNEAVLVRHLFLVQFALGIATSFLYTASLTFFLSTYTISYLPRVFILSALLILFFNKVYEYFEKKYTPEKLLQLVVQFSLFSTLAFLVILKIFSVHWLILLLAAWNVLLYMLIGYAFWGLSALLFNVRESKRVFSIVGSGDIPAKMLGYLCVSVLVHFTSIVNLLCIPVASLAVCWFLVNRLKHYTPHVSPVEHEAHKHHTEKENVSFSERIIRIFDSKLVLFISLVSLVAFIIFSFVDFTFLADIKLKYHDQKELASFIAVFFAGGRIFAVLIKTLISSRMIARIGLLNSLMITPLVLLIINLVIISSNGAVNANLYIFGFMVLVIEVLRSTVQDPVFFILFQPLNPHSRLKGHLIAKGYTFPIALIGVGTFLLYYLNAHADVSIQFFSKATFIFLVFWIGIVFLIRKEYTHTLLHSLSRGHFNGSELFLNDEAVSNLLVRKSRSNNPLEVINALNLLERSQYPGMYAQLIDHLQHNPITQIREYVLERIIANQMTSALSIIRKQIRQDELLTPYLYKALFYLETSEPDQLEKQLQNLSGENKRAALIGLSFRMEEQTTGIVLRELQLLSESEDLRDVQLALSVIAEVPSNAFAPIVRKLLYHQQKVVYQNAISISGKLKDDKLFKEAMALAVNNNAMYRLEKALVEYGDDSFIDGLLPATITDNVQKYVIKAAARIKGPRSDAYLLSLFETNDSFQELVIDALWKKKVSLPLNSSLEAWIWKKLEYMKNKVDWLLMLQQYKEARLLKRALLSEIEADLETVLKACSLLFNKEELDQFINVYKLENTTRVANAIEFLEMTIPKKYFTPILYFIELCNDAHNKHFVAYKKDRNIEQLIREIVTNHMNIFSLWSQALAIYVSPKLLTREAALEVAGTAISEEKDLIKETRAYVLSILK